MEIINKVINLLGLSPEDQAVSLLLDEHKISERPQYEEAPMQWLSKEDEGFILKFDEKLGYERNYGHSLGSGTMVLSGLRVHGPLNTNGFAPYQGKLPCGLHFSQNFDEINRVLGTPDVEDDPGTPERVLAWNNVQGLQLGVVLTADEYHMCYLDIRLVKTKYRR